MLCVSVCLMKLRNLVSKRKRERINTWIYGEIEFLRLCISTYGEINRFEDKLKLFDSLSDMVTSLPYPTEVLFA